jgi:hypothetical protein
VLTVIWNVVVEGSVCVPRSRKINIVLGAVVVGAGGTEKSIELKIKLLFTAIT